MKILVVSDSLPSPSRPERGLFNLRHADALSQWAEVTTAHLDFVTAERGAEGVEQIAEGSIRIRIAGNRVVRQLRSAKAVADVARGFDVVHSMAFESLMACRTVSSVGTAWVHSEHSQNFHNPEGSTPVRTWIAASRHLIRRPVLVTAVSSYLAEGIVGSGRTLPTLVVPNVVPPSVARASSRAPTDALRIVAVGRCVASKQPEVALRVVSILRSQGVPAELTWIGGGPLRDPLKAYAAELRIAEHVSFLDFMPASRYPAILGEFHVFLLPTLHETFCVSAAEAIASGLPVVIGDVGGHRDFVTADNGVLVPARGAAAEYAEAIRRVVDAVPSLPTRDSVDRLLAEHSTKAVAAGFEGAYRAVGLI